MKGWVGLVGWPTADGLPISMVTHQLQVRCRPVKVCRSETDVLPLSHPTAPFTSHTMYFPSTHLLSRRRFSCLRSTWWERTYMENGFKGKAVDSGSPKPAYVYKNKISTLKTKIKTNTPTFKTSSLKIKTDRAYTIFQVEDQYTRNLSQTVLSKDSSNHSTNRLSIRVV